MNRSSPACRQTHYDKEKEHTRKRRRRKKDQRSRTNQCNTTLCFVLLFSLRPWNHRNNVSRPKGGTRITAARLKSLMMMMMHVVRFPEDKNDATRMHTGTYTCPTPLCTTTGPQARPLASSCAVAVTLRVKLYFCPSALLC